MQLQLNRKYDLLCPEVESEQSALVKAKSDATRYLSPRLTFPPIESVTSCRSALFAWHWSGPPNLSMKLMIVNNDSTKQNTQSSTLIADNLDPLSNSFIWQTIDLPSGRYVLQASVTGCRNLATSLPFFVSTEPCLERRDADKTSTVSQTASSNQTSSTTSSTLSSTPTLDPTTSTLTSTSFVTILPSPTPMSHQTPNDSSAMESTSSSSSDSSSTNSTKTAIALGTIGGVSIIATIIALLLICYGKRIRLSGGKFRRSPPSSTLPTISPSYVPRFDNKTPEPQPRPSSVTLPHPESGRTSVSSSIFYYANSFSVSNDSPLANANPNFIPSISPASDWTRNGTLRAGCDSTVLTHG